MLTIIPVTNYKEIQAAIGEFPNSPDNTFYYRGLRKGYSITPSIAYPDSASKLTSIEAFSSYEEKTITAFYSHLRDGVGINTYSLSDWDLWFLARHFGLKSRLTDFTKDFTIAFQFATEMSGKSPCQLYCLDINGIQHIQQAELGDTFSYPELCLIQPTLQYRQTMDQIGVSRMFIQSGKFLHQPVATVLTPLTDQIDERYWRVLEIQPEHFDVIRDELQISFGVDLSKPLVTSHAIDGMCHHVNQSHLN